MQFDLILHNFFRRRSHWLLAVKRISHHKSFNRISNIISMEPYLSPNNNTSLGADAEEEDTCNHRTFVMSSGRSMSRRSPNSSPYRSTHLHPTLPQSDARRLEQQIYAGMQQYPSRPGGVSRGGVPFFGRHHQAALSAERSILHPQLHTLTQHLFGVDLPQQRQSRQAYSPAILLLLNSCVDITLVSSWKNPCFVQHANPSAAHQIEQQSVASSSEPALLLIMACCRNSSQHPRTLLQVVSEASLLVRIPTPPSTGH